MATPIATLKMMDDGHAIAVLRAEMDDLTSTPLELFLLDWIESLIENGSGAHKEVAEEFDLDVSDIEKLGNALIQNADNSAAILNALIAEDIDSPKAAKALIEFRNKFDGIANDAGDFFTRLTDLINQAKE